MSLTYFDILSKVIYKDVIRIASSDNISNDEVFDRINREISNCHDEWFSDKVPNLDYCKQECRLGYLYKIAASNANTLEHIIETDSHISEYFDSIVKSTGNLDICAFGSGPGTELLALAKYYEKRNFGKPICVNFLLLDKVKEWMNSWFGIKDEINSYFSNAYSADITKWPIITTGNLIPCDVTQSTDLKALGNVWIQKVFIFNYILSEIFVYNPGFNSFIKTVAECAPNGSHFIFIERRGYRWKKSMAKIANDAGLQLAAFQESHEYSLDSDEDPRLLGDIYSYLSRKDVNPKQDWNVVYSYGIKA